MAKTSKGGCTWPQGAVPAMESSTLCPHVSVTNCSLHSAGHCHLPKAFSVCHECLRDGLFALNIKRPPSIKMNKYFLTYRGGDSREIPPSNLRRVRHARGRFFVMRSSFQRKCKNNMPAMQLQVAIYSWSVGAQSRYNILGLHWN